MELFLINIIIALISISILYFVVKAAIKNAIYDAITDPKVLKSLTKLVIKTIEENK
jgi:hypothetical protein